MNTSPVLLILAGGRGERAGIPKGLIEFNARPWLEQQIRAYQEISTEPPVIVLGFRHDDYFAAMPWLSKANVVINAHPERGQFSSLQAGLKKAQGRDVFVLPIDVPVCDTEVFKKLEEALKRGAQACVPTWQDRGGHPVLLSRALVEKLSTYPQAARLDEELKKLPSQEVVRVAVEDARVCMNINTTDDWKRFTA